MYSIPLSQLILFVLNRGLFVGVYSAKCIGEKWNIFYPAIIKNLFCAFVIYIVSVFVNNLINPETWLSLICECGLLGCVALVFNGCVIFGPRKVILMCKETQEKYFQKLRKKGN